MDSQGCRAIGVRDKVLKLSGRKHTTSAHFSPILFATVPPIVHPNIIILGMTLENCRTTARDSYLPKSYGIGSIN
jgi:hypothetical protein